MVAVKRLDRNGLQGTREFFAEVMVLSLAQHPNLVNLIGYCVEDEQRVLVYEFMPNGSLEDHLFGNCCDLYMLYHDDINFCIVMFYLSSLHKTYRKGRQV